MGTDIEPFLTGRGTISFTDERPLTEKQIKTIVKVRLEEVARE
jgi:hypothetical protein